MITLVPQIYLKKKQFKKHIVKLMMKSVMNIMMIVWKVYYLVTFFLKKMTMIMRRDIATDVIPARKALSYLT